MSLFRCSECGCVENTAVCNYWDARYGKDQRSPVCSECDPEIGQWHGIFEKRSASGYHIGEDGFLYHEDHLKQVTHTKIVGVVE